MNQVLERNIISVVAIILSIGAIIMVGSMTYGGEQSDLSAIEKRLDEQQGVIQFIADATYNNTQAIGDQQQFNQDMFNWAVNATGRINSLSP